jgi:hypothetical protein
MPGEKQSASTAGRSLEHDTRSTGKNMGSVALKDFRETVAVSNFYGDVAYLNTLLTASEIAHLAGGSVRGTEDWLRKARQGEKSRRTRSTAKEEPIRKTMAVLEYMEAELDCSPELQGEFLRSYVIDTDSHEALSMLDLIREDKIPLVIERAEQVFQPK